MQKSGRLYWYTRFPYAVACDHRKGVVRRVPLILLRLSPCKEVCLLYSKAKSGVSRVFFHPEIASESKFNLESHLVLFLQHLHC